MNFLLQGREFPFLSDCIDGGGGAEAVGVCESVGTHSPCFYIYGLKKKSLSGKELKEMQWV